MSRADRSDAAIGVVESANTAVLVTVGPGAVILERRQVELTPPGTPTHPHHHEGSWAVGRYLDTPGARPMTLEAAVALVDRVRGAAALGARAALEATAAAVAEPISTIALRAVPPLPPTVEARIRDPRAQTMADSVMYRDALAHAARARGWAVVTYERDRVLADAAAVLGDRALEEALAAMKRAVGAPWRAEHKRAAAAAILARLRA